MPNLVQSIILYAAAAAIISLGFYFHGEARYSAGRASAFAEVKAAVEEQNKKLASTKKKVKHETQGLDRSGIIRELCAGGWVRNPDKCPH